MDGHDPHDIGVLVECIGLTVIYLLLLHSVYIAEELEQAGKFRFSERICVVLQHAQVCSPLSPRRKRCAEILITGFFQKAVDYFSYGAILHPLSPLS